MKPDPTLSLDFATLRAAYRDGLSPLALLEDIIARMRKMDPGIYISRFSDEELRAQAAALGSHDPARPLWGLPCAVKDNIDVAGLPTTCACPDYAYVPGSDARAVALLRDAGAIIIGKTNLDQFATGLVGVRSPYPPPRNTFDPRYVPGGSSSGSAVAVAAGLVSFSLGTDTAGSGRVPAALNNIVGLKPSLGAVSSRGLVPACRTLDCISVFALTVDDAGDVYDVIRGYDPAEAFSRRLPATARGAPPARLRLGVPDRAGRLFGEDERSEAAFDAALATLASRGWAQSPVDLSACFETAALLYAGPWVAERYQAIRSFIEAAPGRLHPVTRGIIQSAGRHSASDAFAGLYRLTELRRKAEKLWQDMDVLVVPTYPRPRTVAELEADPIGPNSELGTYTNFVNLLDWCALAVPGPFREDGFPSGITLIAPAGMDGLLASIGAAFQQALGGTLGATGKPLPPSRQLTPHALPGEIELTVVGAHMSGMALNGELTRLGGRFLRAGRTKPSYRLFVLPGQPPRPALMRSARGVAIEAEVWALPTYAMGDFISGVPAPLGIGTAMLEDGSSPRGFIAEAGSLDDARDISEFGGWRTYLASLGGAGLNQPR